MTFVWRVAKRAAFAVLAAYLVLTIAFALVFLTPDPNKMVFMLGAALGGQDPSAAAAAYEASRNRNVPFLVRYGHWLLSYSTFEWGVSYNFHEPVTGLIAEHLKVTLAYVLPAIVVSTVGGVLVGLHSALNRNTIVDRLERIGAYSGASVPNFVLANFVLLVVVFYAGLNPFYDSGLALTHPTNLRSIALPALVLSTSMLAVQIRYARSETVQAAAEEFVKVARAKGGGNVLVARHILTVAAVPIMSLFVSELLAALLLSTLVLEKIFALPGFGSLMVGAIENRDMPLILGTTMVVVIVGVTGNFLSDVAHLYLDPRVED